MAFGSNITKSDLDWCSHRRYRFVYVSSSAVYFEILNAVVSLIETSMPLFWRISTNKFGDEFGPLQAVIFDIYNNNSTYIGLSGYNLQCRFVDTGISDFRNQFVK